MRPKLSRRPSKDVASRLRAYNDAVWNPLAPNTLTAFVQIIESRPALEELIRDRHRPRVFHPSARCIHAPIIATHPSPWSVSIPEVPTDASSGDIEYLMAVWHHLLLNPSKAPSIPWLDSQVRYLLTPRVDDLLAEHVAVYSTLLFSIAARVGYKPSRQTAMALAEAKHSIDPDHRYRSPELTHQFRTADLLDRLSILPDSTREYLCLRAMATGTPPYMFPFLYPRTQPPESPVQHLSVNPATSTTSISYPHSATQAQPEGHALVERHMDAWRHVGYDTASMAAMSAMDRKAPPLLALATLLSPVHRLTWLSRPDVADFFPFLFILPMYAPSQFTAIDPATWATALATAHPSTRQSLLSLWGQTQKLIPSHSVLTPGPACDFSPRL